MKKVTFSLNYRKPKSQYKPDEELMVCTRLYYKCPKTNQSKIKKHSTGIKCKLKDWDKDWHSNIKRNPIKATDPLHIEKNKSLSAIVLRIDNCRGKKYCYKKQTITF